MPQNSNFRLPLGPSWGQWGPIGSKKWVKTVKHYHAPKFEFSTTLRSSISAKIRTNRYGAKSWWGLPRVHLGANRVPLGPKNGSKPWKITMPQKSNFLLYRGHRFRPKSDLRVMAPNHGGDPLGSILGPMGSHWVKKMGQNRKKLPCPKIRIFDYPAVIDFGQKPTLRLWRQITVGTPGVHLGANGVPLGPKNGSKPWKITMPQNSNFRQPRGNRLRPKSDITVMAVNHVGDPLGSILGPMGSHWVQNMGQKRKNLPCPKIRIFDYPGVIDFGQNPTLRLWRQITVGNPRGHIGANGVPLGPKNGSKP